METLNYRPHKLGFPYKFLKYLYDNGTSYGTDIQQAIGLNDWADRMGRIYFTGASTNFDMNAKTLALHGMITILPDDMYEITKEGKNLVKSYIRKR